MSTKEVARNVTRTKLQECLGGSLSLGLGFSVKILKLACFLLLLRNGECHLQVQMVGG